jgi:predicted TIM-barrel fold metal-dependent hydrolase
MISGEPGTPPPPQPGIGTVTDAHVHVVSHDVLRFPRRTGGPGRDWWTGRAVDGDAVLGDIVDAGVGRAVVVQAVGAYGDDNRYARSVVDSHPGRLAFVPAIDPDGDDPAEELVALMAQGSMAGVRLFGISADPAWLVDGRGRAVWGIAAANDITLVPTLLRDHLEGLRTLVTRMPDARVALDHCAFPDLRSGPPYPEATALFDLADCPSVHLKITTVVLRHAADHGGTTVLVEHLVDTFGPDRLCWGSDHPQTFELRYPEMVDLARDALHTVDSAAQRSILGLTAQRLFWRSET